jgi:hypothetical protein
MPIRRETAGTWLALLTLGVLAIMTGGCSTSAPPRMSVQSASLTEQSDGGLVLVFDMLAENVNSDPLPLADVTYEVRINNRPVFRGVRSAESTVRRYGTQSFRLPASMPRSAVEGIKGGEAEYKLIGQVTYLRPGILAKTLFDIEVLRPSQGFSARGPIDLQTLRPEQEGVPEEVPDPEGRVPTK